MISINARTAKDTTMRRLSNEDRLVAIGMIEGGLSVREVARIFINNQQTNPEKPGNQLCEGQDTSWKAEGHHTGPEPSHPTDASTQSFSDCIGYSTRNSRKK
ncbi:UNVERIFIED_CONTAM: hypothetical protein FKN15_051928 [Acipenser sinensis]